MEQTFYDLLKDAAFAGGGGGSPAPVLIEKSVTQNGTYSAQDDEADGYSEVTVDVDGGAATLITKSIAANGTYAASSDNADGYSSVSVEVEPDLTTKSITVNGTYNATSDNADGYSSVTVAVPNTYAAGDEGKVVQNGALVAQTSTAATANGTINTTTNNSVTVNVPNTYTQADEGKVVSNGALVAQVSDEATENGTIDTTLISSLLVNVPSSSDPEVYHTSYQGIILTSTCGVYFGGRLAETSKKGQVLTLTLPETFPVEKIGSTIFGYCNRGSSTVSIQCEYDAALRRMYASVPSTTTTYTGLYYMIMFSINTTD